MRTVRPILRANGCGYVTLAGGNGQVVIDEADIPLVDGKSFRLLNGESKGLWGKRVKYAGCSVTVDGKHTTKKLHHFILPKKDGYEVDHIDHDPLNCRRSNLQHLTHRENVAKSNQRRLALKKAA